MFRKRKTLAPVLENATPYPVKAGWKSKRKTAYPSFRSEEEDLKS
jgi:hypothetical protein